MTDATEETMDAGTDPAVVSGVAKTVAGDDASSAVSSARSAPRAQPEVGGLIGRYVVLSKLGAGAMGVVLAAYDPELDRKVALKLLKTRPGRDSEAAHARLQREAQALAKLNHTNVVGVHDVGVHEGRVFVAMEFVEGQTLADWMRSGPRDEPRPWQEVLELFVAAGRGLAAAHQQGLIHRDFKPDNVMLGDDGRVRVMDFGLARADEDGPRAPAEPTPLEASTQSSLDTPITQTGALMGTPAYMAPEQFGGKEVTARSDQFGYCVALFEALYGMRPFRGETVPQLAFAVFKGEILEPPRTYGVPAWLSALVRRGLASEPARRFEDMPTLVAALGAGEGRRRTNRLLAGVGLVAVSAAAVVGYQGWDEQQRTGACVADGDRIDEIWNDETRTRLREGLLATGVSYAPTTAEKTVHYFDAQAEALREAQTQACLETRVREDWSEDLLDRSTWCLDEGRLELAALLEELSKANLESVRKAVIAASQLSEVDACRDESRLGRSPPPPEDREAVLEVRKTLSKAGALLSAGEYEGGLEIAREALGDAQAVGSPVLTAKAGLRIGNALARTGDYEAAETALQTAYFDAAKAGANGVLADAATSLVYVTGDKLSRHEDGRLWGQHASIALDGLGESETSLRRAGLVTSLGLVADSAGDYETAKALHERALAITSELLGPEHPRTAKHLNNLASVQDVTGAYEEAKALHERALAIWEQALGPKHPLVATSLSNLALVQWSLGALDEAEASHRRALAIYEEAFGPEHPDVARCLSNLAFVKDDRGAYDEARRLNERALAIREKTLGPEHPDVATSLNSLAVNHKARGEYEQARSLYERAFAIWEPALGPDHASVASVVNNLAGINYMTGQLEEAKAGYERSLAITEKTLGPEHPNVAIILANLGQIHADAERYDDAAASFRRTIAILEKALGPEHAAVAHGLVGLAKVSLEQNRPAEALDLANRAVTLRTPETAPPEHVAEAQFTLARALWDVPRGGGRDRPRARELAKQALDTFRNADGQAEHVETVEAWLAKPGG